MNLQAVIGCGLQKILVSRNKELEWIKEVFLSLVGIPSMLLWLGGNTFFLFFFHDFFEPKNLVIALESL